MAGGGTERVLDQFPETLVPVSQPAGHGTVQLSCVTSLSLCSKQDSAWLLAGLHRYEKQELLGWYLAHRRYLVAVRQIGYLDEQDKHMTF